MLCPHRIWCLRYFQNIAKTIKCINNIFYFLITYGVCKKKKYFNRMSEKKIFPFDECSCFVSLRTQNKQKKSICRSVCLSVDLSGYTYVRTWILAVDTITFDGVSGSKHNLVEVFYVWNVGLVLKSKVKSWSWSWSWTGFWFWQKLWGTTPNLVGIFRI